MKLNYAHLAHQIIKEYGSEILLHNCKNGLHISDKIRLPHYILRDKKEYNANDKKYIRNNIVDQLNSKGPCYISILFMDSHRFAMGKEITESFYNSQTDVFWSDSYYLDEALHYAINYIMQNKCFNIEHKIKIVFFSKVENPQKMGVNNSYEEFNKNLLMFMNEDYNPMRHFDISHERILQWHEDELKQGRNHAMNKSSGDWYED